MKKEEVSFQVKEIAAQLSEQGRYHLSKALISYRDFSAKEYMAKLYNYKPGIPLDQALKSSFASHLCDLGYLQDDIDKALSFFEENRCLQTSPHVGASQSARMLCISWLTSLTPNKEDPILIGYYSGVPFSNSSRPGQIKLASGDLQLIPARYQNQLTCRHQITNKLVSTISQKLPELNSLAGPVEGSSFVDWALALTRLMDSKIFPNRSLVYFDINAVSSSYLQKVLQDKDNVINKIIFSSKGRSSFARSFDGANVWFYSVAEGSKGESHENICLDSSGLYGKKLGFVKNSEHLLQLLEEGKLVPATLTVFLIWSFLNHTRAFGSFLQVEYLSHFKNMWMLSGLLKDYSVEMVPTVNLTTGTFAGRDLNRGNARVYYEGGWNPSLEVKMAELWLAMKDVLLP